MPGNLQKKNKIDLTGYNYRRDIENRLLMASLSVFEVEVLREILQRSVKIQIADLARALHTTVKALSPVLAKLKTTQLLSYDDAVITVDKEMRRYYELQIDKFDDDFQPNLVYLQTMLNKVPIEVLPVWYAIPRMSDHIIASIIEKNLATPKIFRRYLEELEFESPIQRHIMDDVFSAPDGKVHADTLREKYGLTREAFEEALLWLEFNFVCFLSYNRLEDMWQEVVTPFWEWREYLRFERSRTPKSIGDVSHIAQDKRKGLPHDLEELPNDRNIRLTEKALQSVMNSGWVMFEDFVKGIIEPIGSAAEVSLQKTRGHWAYLLPVFSAKDRESIRDIIFEKLALVGVIATGTYHGAPCFTVTPFGKTVLGE